MTWHDLEIISQEICWCCSLGLSWPRPIRNLESTSSTTMETISSWLNPSNKISRLRARKYLSERNSYANYWMKYLLATTKYTNIISACHKRFSPAQVSCHEMISTAHFLLIPRIKITIFNLVSINIKYKLASNLMPMLCYVASTQITIT